MDVQAVSTALVSALAPLGIHAYDYGPDAPISPAVYVYPSSFPYHVDYSASGTVEFIVRFLVQSVHAQNGQATLNGYISTSGSTSASQLIEADRTLGGVVQSVSVMTMRDYGVVQLPDLVTRYYSAELMVEVLA